MVQNAKIMLFADGTFPSFLVPAPETGDRRNVPSFSTNGVW